MRNILIVVACPLFAGVAFALTQTEPRGDLYSAKALQALERCFDSAGTFICSAGGGAATVGVVNPPGGTTNRVSKWTAATILGDSSITDTGTSISASVADSITWTVGTDSGDLLTLGNGAGAESIVIDNGSATSMLLSSDATIELDAGGDLNLFSTGGVASISGFTVQIQPTSGATFLARFTAGQDACFGSTSEGDADGVCIDGGTGLITFEGATANTSETTLGVTDPTADIAFTLPNNPAGSYPLVSSTHSTNAVGAASSVWTEFNAVVWEGSTVDGFETVLRATNPTQDNFMIMPDGISGIGTVLLDNYALLAGATRLQLGIEVFATLGSPANANIVYCSNCTIANPCASGGTGAVAKRINSVWVCN